MKQSNAATVSNFEPASCPKCKEPIAESTYKYCSYCKEPLISLHTHCVNCSFSCIEAVTGEIPNGCPMCGHDWPRP